MRIEIAKHERMAETGRSLLRLIQNHDMPLLDLLVRESVQNSLDAALAGDGFVQIDFSIRNFNKNMLARHLEGIEQRLSEMYPETEYRLMEIRDSNTTGLTGPLHESTIHSGEFGNLIKLIYQIGMPQQKEGSGGSWGLGKTVYFRIGIGLVFYYSRVFEDGKYSSRLAACLVEDETRENALLSNMGMNRGIAWWGQTAPDGSTMPVTDENEILEILEALGCKPFEGSQTGTAVIIPFMRNDLRPELAVIDNDEDALIMNQYTPPWSRSDEEYIFVALQRWYAPRLMNPHYPHGRWLRATVNGKGIVREQFMPVFRTIQDLYNHANDESLSNSKTEDNVLDVGNIRTFPVRLNSTFKKSMVAGWVSIVKLDKSALLMNPPDNNPSPWAQVYGRDYKFENNPAIIAYTRKPGMLVGYEYEGKWADSISKLGPDEYLLGIFVANSSNELLEKHPRDPGKTFSLEEYIRGCELADHTTWTDWVPNKKNPLIIDRIQRHVKRGISRLSSEKPSSAEMKRDMALGKMLASALLPPEGFGTSPDMSSAKARSKGTSSSGRTGGKPQFVSISPPVYENDLVRIDFELYTGKSDEQIEIKLRVISETGEIDADSWEGKQGVGTRFPVCIKNAVIRHIHSPKLSRNECEEEIHISSAKSVVKMGGFKFKGTGSKVFNRYHALQCTGLKDRFIKGSLFIESSNRNIRAAVNVSSRAGVGNR